jgi:trk system potassium uptake protein TrkH
MERVGHILKNWIRIMKKWSHHMTAGHMMAVGFAAAILAGGVLLSLPVCNADGHFLAFEDALFTACSAVCVTGLVTIVPATQFSLFGKMILLLLIQFGGLGIIACTMGAFLILRRKITMRDRVLIQQNYDQNTMSGIVRLLRYVFLGTFLAEGLGAVGFAFQFVPEYGVARGIWYAVFHSISTYCNAGIDILGENSFGEYVTNPLMNTVTILLIIFSGLGFPVWKELTLAARRIWHRECTPRRAVRRMSLHAKMALAMTLFLVVGGTVGIYLMERTNPDTISQMSLGEQWMASLFQSVTTRTAGFFTIPQNQFREQTRLLSCMLMFIGGCPGGTAGGVKTTTILLLLMTCGAVLKGKEDTECFGRRIPFANIRTGFAVFSVSFLAVLFGTLLLLVFEPVRIADALYEVVSAVATVGLTAGITSLLSTGGKLLIIVLMYLGRLSPVTMALIFATKLGRKKTKAKLPEERIMVG